MTHINFGPLHEHIIFLNQNNKLFIININKYTQRSMGGPIQHFTKLSRSLKVAIK